MKTYLDTSTLKILRVTGFVYLLTLIIPTLNWIFIFSPFLSSGSNILTVILEKEFLFRFNIMNQIITSVSIIILGYLLYIILKTVNKNISFIALLFKIFESVFFLVIAFVYLIVLSIIKTGLIEGVIVKELIDNYISYTAIPGVFLGLSMLLFLVLFYKSGIIPKWMAIWGIIAYFLVIIYDSCVILSLHTWAKLFMQIAGTTPVCLFQITMSFYLIFKNNKYEKE